MNIKSILVVCVGNMCRSPTAEYLLKEKLKGIQVTSAGLMARKNKSACPKAIEIAASNGLDISPHKTRKLTPEMVAQNDLVLAMEAGHTTEILSVAPFAHGKVIKFGRWSGDEDIADPYLQSDAMYQAVFSKLKEQAHNWANKLDISK